MDTLTKLIALYNNKEAGAYHKLVEEMLLHLHAIPGMSIYELADICYSSTTAISRFVRKLEYSDFHLFKSSLANALNYYPQNNRKMPITNGGVGDDFIGQYTSMVCRQMETLRISGAEIDGFVQKIAESQKIIFISQAEFNFTSFQYDLFLQGKTSLFSDNLTASGEDLEQADSGSFALFFITPERESNRTEALLKKAADKNAQIGVVARDVFNIPHRQSPLLLTYESTGTDMDELLLCHIMNLMILRFRMLYVDQ